MFVRPATTNDALEVRRILDAAVLEYDALDERITAGDVLVAGDRVERPAADDGAVSDTTDQDRRGRERILGAIVLEPSDRGAHVAAIAVRRRHRAGGIGRQLVERARKREGTLVARFDAGVRAFYESLGFSIEPLGNGRYRGVGGD